MVVLVWTMEINNKIDILGRMESFLNLREVLHRYELVLRDHSSLTKTNKIITILKLFG